MKITKYPQSNFLIESSGKRIIIDPGNLTFEKYKPADFGDLDAILITHSHPDHFHKEAVVKFIEQKVPLYGNHDVVKQFETDKFEVLKVEHGKEFEVAGFQIKPIDIPHFQLLYCEQDKKPLTADEITPDKRCKLHPDLEPGRVDGPPNTGFLVNGVFFHPGDGIEKAGLTIENAAIPINGPTIDFDRAWAFSNSLQAKKIIPMHYSHPTFKVDPHEFAKVSTGNTKVIVLNDGESTNID